MAAIDPAALAAQMESAASAAVGQDVTAIGGFSKDQLTAIAQQSADVAAGIADGSITGDTQTFMLSSLKEMVRSFVNVLVGLAAVTVEETWNAVVGVLWTAIGKATGLALTPP
jgi:hypothetical protein